MTEPLEIVIVGGDPLARAGLVTLLEEAPGLMVVGRVDAAGGNLPAELALYRPDVVVWDLGWDAEEVVVDFEAAGAPVVVLLPDEALAPDALHAGARGLLLRDGAGRRLEAALAAVDAGLLVVDPAFGGELSGVSVLLRSDADLDPAEPLTAREQEVLDLLAEGLSNRAIALELSISQHTVKFHVNSIMTKLDAQSRTEAVVRATRMGLILL